MVGANHCPPGPIGKKCRENKEVTGSDEGGNSSGGSSGSSGSNGSSGSSASSGSSGGGSSSVNLSTYDDGSGGSSGNGSGGGTSGISKFINSTEGKATSITLAAVAASVAIGAMYMGSKKRNGNGQKHPLHGTLKRRIGMFSRMAQRNNGATCRPEVDRTVVDGSTDYQLA